MSHKKKI